MAKITAKVTGGKLVELEDVRTVREARKALNLGPEYTATVNGEPEDDGYEVEDFQFVAFAPAVKGGVA